MGKQTVTPTPGAASELPWYMQELPLHVTGTHRNHVHTAKTAHVATFSDSVSAEHFAASVNGNQFAIPPAPVTEGAQREADYECKCGWRGNVPDTGAILECPSCHSDWNIHPVPPPPDRVQPERGEDGWKKLAADFGSYAVHRDNCPSAHGQFGCDCGLQPIIDSYSTAMSAPPTDASGGVTDAMVEAACGEYSQFWLETGGHEAERIRKRVRAILEAADRARKPGYRQVTLDDIDVLNLAVDKWMTTEVGFTCDDKDFSLKEAHFRRRMFAALQHIGAVIPDARK